MKHFFTIFTLLLVTISITHAREGKANVEFSCASWDKMIEEIYYLSSSDAKSSKYEVIKVGQMFRGAPQKANTAAPLQFFRKNTLNETGYEEIGRVKLSTTSNRYLLLFMPSNKANKYSIKVIPDDRKNSPFGAYAFYNFTNIPIEGVLSKQKFKVAPGKLQLVRLNLKQGASMPFATFVTIEGKRQWLQRNTFHFNPKKHAKFFIYTVPSTKDKMKVKMKAIIEFNQPAPKKGETATG